MPAPAKLLELTNALRNKQALVEPIRYENVVIDTKRQIVSTQELFKKQNNRNSSQMAFNSAHGKIEFNCEANNTMYIMKGFNFCIELRDSTKCNYKKKCFRILKPGFSYLHVIQHVQLNDRRTNSVDYMNYRKVPKVTILLFLFSNIGFRDNTILCKIFYPQFSLYNRGMTDSYEFYSKFGRKQRSPSSINKKGN